MSEQIKIKRTYSISHETVEMIERLAVETKRDLSAVVEVAVEKYEQSHRDAEEIRQLFRQKNREYIEQNGRPMPGMTMDQV